MKPISLKDIRIKGELAVRSGLNFSRLEGQWYRPEEVFRADSHGWPGDWEGRIILALTLLAQSTHRTPAYLDEIVELIPSHLNEKGYFGPILPPGKFDEQHFGGHSWIIRALCEYYLMTGKEEVKAMLERLVRNFLLPAAGSYAQYPIGPVSRFQQPGPWILSKLQTKTKHHAETSDAGCAFIMIDGAAHAYELLRWPELAALAEEMITRFMEMDLEALHIQTHATLSAIRGILRYYELTGEKKYLEMAEGRFNLYIDSAWTEAYGNYNWFGAPRWTEPCAIIDSFMAAVNLWKHTAKAAYLDYAHLIYFNAVCHGFRVNGSFGTDRCCGARDTEDSLFIAPINYETYWCCTMRGGEGHSRAIEYNFFTEGNNVYVPFYNSCSGELGLDSGTLKIEEKTHYPYDGLVSFQIVEGTLPEAGTLNFYIPAWAHRQNLKILLNGLPLEITEKNGFAAVCSRLGAGDVIAFDLGLSARVEEAVFKNSIRGTHKFMYGPMLLGCKVSGEISSLDGNRFENYAESKYKASMEIKLSGNAELERLGRSEFRVKGTDIVLSSLCDVHDLTCEDSMKQVLFRE